MKTKLLFTAVVLFLTIGMQAQQTQLMSKKGVPILPETGDYMIGIDASPFFSYFGNMFNGNTANPSPSFGFTATTPLSIYGKYMTNENTAYRGIFRIGYTNTKDKAYIIEDGQSAPIDPEKTVEDFHKINQFHITLGAGLEKRRGKGRLQGLYGGQLLFFMNTNKHSYKYGNDYSTTNTNPSRTNFGMNNPGGTAWTTSDKTGTNFGFGLQAFVGAEYFFAPKMSISGEFYYGLSYSKTGDGKVISEAWDPTASNVKESTSITGGASFFGFDTAVTGALNFNFYF
jgi:hypothetical protein